jgi:subtilisin family serine protease
MINEEKLNKPGKGNSPMKIERPRPTQADAKKTLRGLRCILCSLFVIAALIAAVGAVASLRASQGVAASMRATAMGNPKIAPWVMQHTANGQQAEFFVLLADQADLSHADALQTKAQKGQYVYNTLLNKSQMTQGPILRWLRERRLEHRSFYIVNGILVKGTREIAAILAARTDVARVEGNPLIRNNLPEPGPVVEAPPSVQRPETIEPGINYTHAPQVWALGFTGQDIVVGSLDSGVRWTHNALKPHYRGWDGQNADHDYNWHDSIHDSIGNPCDNDSPQPCDDNTHGSHTTGTAVGDDGVGNQVGMAPGAKWIGCRGLDQGNGTPARYIECMEWFLAPYPIGGGKGDPTKAPDITINSWFCNPDEGCSPDTLQAAVEAQVAAGIMMVVCAANDGPNCSTVDDPPAIYEAAYTVGALITGTDTIADFSNRGPVTIDGSGRIKPDIAAPGTSTRSCSNADDNSYAILNGTSRATPHISGAMALLWSAIPSLRHQITTSRDTLNNSAVHIASTQCGTAGPPNNVYGWGRVDILAAVGGTTPSPTPTPTATPTPTGTPAPTPCTSWMFRSSVPYSAGGMFAASDGRYVYTGGGGDINAVHNDLLRYDPLNGSWTSLAPSPDQHALSQAVYFKGKLYNMGGFLSDLSTVSDTTRIYDIGTNTWTTGEPIPATLGAPATMLLDGIIYVAGGYDGEGDVDTLYAYDIASDTWTTDLARMPQALHAPGFGAIDGKLYVAGGYSSFGVVFDTLQIYDIAANTWTTGPNVPQGVGYCGSTVLNGLLYLYGGVVQSNPRTLTNITQIYDPGSGWSNGPNMNVSRFWLYGTAVGNDSIVAPGGVNANIIGLDHNEQLITIPCSTPTPTPTSTPTATATHTPTVTPTSTPTSTATPTATPTSTSRPSPTPRPALTPRPRPTPPPRP